MVKAKINARIVIVCKSCGFKLYEINGENRERFAGVPILGEVLKKHYGLECPACGRQLDNAKPRIRLYPNPSAFSRDYLEDKFFIRRKRR